MAAFVLCLFEVVEYFEEDIARAALSCRQKDALWVMQNGVVLMQALGFALTRVSTDLVAACSCYIVAFTFFHPRVAFNLRRGMLCTDQKIGDVAASVLISTGKMHCGYALWASVCASLRLCARV
jgi:hypothetical protein